MLENFNSDLLNKIEKEGVNSAFFEHLLSTLFNTFPDHIYLKDTQSKFIKINQSLANLFNIKDPVEAVGKSDFDFFPIEHARVVFEDEQEIMKSGIGKNNFIEKVTFVNGDICWVASTKVPFHDENGNVVGLFGISRDITARKMAEIQINNRAEELECFIQISRIAKLKDLSVEGFIKKIVDIIPKYLAHANIICSRVVIGNKAIKSVDFIETEYLKKYKIKENNVKIGFLEVFFSVDAHKGPNKLALETGQVLKLIVDRLSEIMEKKWIELDLRKWEHILKNAESHMDLYP